MYLALISFLGMLVPLVATGLVFIPSADLSISGLFYDTAAHHFYLYNFLPLQLLSDLAYHGARVLFFALLAAALFAAIRRRALFTITAKGWVFLIFALLIGPGLVANALFKDNWGRARPREVTVFGGTSQFSPAFYLSNQCDSNCSFISGDASFGFILPCLAYVVPVPKRRRVFWASLGAGSLFGLGRLLTGAHFLSDILWAGLFMFATGALIHALIYGRQATRGFWRTITALCLCLMLFPASANARENIPDPRITPGEALTTDIVLVCQKGYSKTVRHTTQQMKREVYRAYGIKNHLHYKIDHLVPLSLGGADTMSNIWPTDFTTSDHTADDKDRFEIKARHLVCTHQISVAEGQRFFMTDWRQGYDRYCKTRADCPSFEEIQARNLPFP